MIEKLVQWDTAAFWWINDHHAMPLDWILWTLSQGWSWAIVILLVFGCTTLRKEPKNWWVMLICICACFLLGDRISVMCFKDVVCRLRPCHALEGVRMFHTHCGGQYGFVSSHAANVSAIAMLFFLRYRHTARKTRFYWFGLLMWLWAILVMYSRPYLGKHYPGDIICGCMLGTAIGSLVWWTAQVIANKHQKHSIQQET